MNREQLIAEGTRLTAELEAAAEQYHPKADLRTILEYESITIAAYVAFLRDGTPVSDSLKNSTLFSEWGQGYEWRESDLLQRTAAFYAALREIVP